MHQAFLKNLSEELPKGHPGLKTCTPRPMTYQGLDEQQRIHHSQIDDILIWASSTENLRVQLDVLNQTHINSDITCKPVAATTLAREEKYQQ